MFYTQDIQKKMICYNQDIDIEVLYFEVQFFTTFKLKQALLKLVPLFASTVKRQDRHQSTTLWYPHSN